MTNALSLLRPDDKCIEILNNIATVMTPEYSKLLINEMVVPDKGADITTTQLDIVMMSNFAACERTESQWHLLVKHAELRIEKIWTIREDTERIIECVPAFEDGT